MSAVPPLESVPSDPMDAVFLSLSQEFDRFRNNARQDGRLQHLTAFDISKQLDALSEELKGPVQSSQLRKEWRMKAWWNDLVGICNRSDLLTSQPFSPLDIQNKLQELWTLANLENISAKKQVWKWQRCDAFTTIDRAVLERLHAYSTYDCRNSSAVGIAVKKYWPDLLKLSPSEMFNYKEVLTALTRPGTEVIPPLEWRAAALKLSKPSKQTRKK